MNERIAKAQSAVKLAEEALVAVVAEEQAVCPHTRVAEAPWQDQKHLNSLSPRRICMDCGLEEEGSHWSGGHQWSTVDFTPSRLDNAPGRTIVTVVDRQEIYNLRVA